MMTMIFHSNPYSDGLESRSLGGAALNKMTGGDYVALRDQPFLPLYVQDYLTDEKLNACSPATQGVYIKIMCILHKSEEYGKLLLKQKDKQTDSKIKNFAIKLSKLLPFTTEDIESALTELIEEGVMSIDGDVLFQKRMVRDGEISEKRAFAANCRNKNQEFGIAKGSAKRTAKREQIPENENESEYENETDNEEDVIDQKQDALSKRFDEFWAAYPKKVGKAAARKSWMKIKPTKELHAKILSAVVAAKKTEQWKCQNGRFIPHPTTWLNQGRWDDELPQETRTAEGRESDGPELDC